MKAVTYIEGGRVRVPNYVIDRERSTLRHQPSGKEVELLDPDSRAELRRAHATLKGLVL